MMRKWLCTSMVATVVLGLNLPARAWDYVGHQVIASIAWENMTPAARQRAISLLLAAPSDAGLLELLSTDGRPQAEREREFFIKASTWADEMRDDDFPERRAKYHKSSWHYINYFWEQTHPNRRPRDRNDLKPEPENVVERLQKLSVALADTGAEASKRTIVLAWILHLIGDIHQPLHCSARVTPTEPEGDRGGNLFKLDSTTYNLHSYWDRLLRTAFEREPDEGEQAYVNRIANTIMSRNPKGEMEARFKLGDFEAWAKHGVMLAKNVIYPPYLQRDQAPSAQYRRNAYGNAEPAIALAGYRLAETLHRALGK